MIELTFYDEFGKICLNFSGDASIVDSVIARNNEKGYSYVEGHFTEQYYYIDPLTHTPTPKLPQSTAVNKLQLLGNGVDSVVISDPPAGATFSAYNISENQLISGEINGTDTFTSTLLGYTRLSVEHPHYLPFEEWINVI